MENSEQNVVVESGGTPDKSSNLEKQNQDIEVGGNSSYVKSYQQDNPVSDAHLRNSMPNFKSGYDGDSNFGKTPRDILQQGGLIDLENENLTYVQAKAIRQQVQRDCELLGNRVRMLKNEIDRAKKKIKETRKKTNEIRELQYKNDLKWMNQVEQKKRAQQENKPSKSKMEERLKLKKEIEQKQTEIFYKKRQEVEAIKIQQQRNRQLLEQSKINHENEVLEKNRLIRDQKQEGRLKKTAFIQNKVHTAKREVDSLMNIERSDIQNYEKEAEDLERLEAQLLSNLQDTQRHEREVFAKLENAMIDSSVQVRQRTNINGPQSISSRK